MIYYTYHQTSPTTWRVSFFESPGVSVKGVACTDVVTRDDPGDWERDFGWVKL